MYEPVFIFKDSVWQEIPKEKLYKYEFFVFVPTKIWNKQETAWEPDLGVACLGSYNTVGKAKTKITVHTTGKNKGLFRVMARDRMGYNFYPMDIGYRYTNRSLWDE